MSVARKSWSSTIRLPKSGFPAKPVEAVRGPLIKKCSEQHYKWQAETRAHQKPFVLHDGPPYANGPLHVGHALNKILKDIICRVKVQQGHRVEFIPGWDCHGLPIELKALEKHREEKGETEQLDASGIRKVASSLAHKTIKSHMKGFKKWGIMADWDRAWRTMDKSFEWKQLDVFQSMAEKGLIYRKFRPVYWSTASRTALAESELEYNEEHRSNAAFVAFQIKEQSQALKKIQEELATVNNLSLLIWTTTPWTLPANRAIAFNADLDYNIIQVNDEHCYIVAVGQLSYLRTTCFGADDDVRLIGPTFKGDVLAETTYSHMFGGSQTENLPLIHAGYVSADSGTGLVHSAPGHGMDDYLECSKHGIAAVAPVDEAGCYTADAFLSDPEALKGQSVLGSGADKVLELLGTNVVKVHKYKHKYPYDWRTKLPVIVRATAQWFANVGSIKEKAQEHMKDVQFIPASGRNRLESFVQLRNEWCISRQRAWGVPIPTLYDESGNAELSKESVQHIISVMKKRGIDTWFSDPPDEPVWVAPHLEGKYTRGSDTMDVWFDSGTSWTTNEHQADVCLEGSDQHRGWFQSSLLTHTAASPRDTAPYKTVITHGFTLDYQGKKMSKSIGNTIEPQQIIDWSVPTWGSFKRPDAIVKKAPTDPDNHGPDALRLWVASSDYTRDVVVSQTVVTAVSSSLTRYRKILRMLLGSMHQNARVAPITRIDQIALVQLYDVMEEVNTAYDNFEFHKGIKAIDRWIATELSPIYLEAVKDRLYCGDGGGVLEEIFHGLLRMLLPITPVLVEEAWSHRPTWMKERGVKHPYTQTIRDDPIIPDELDADLRDTIRQDTKVLLKAASAIKAAQEHARQAGLMGSSLQSSVLLRLPEWDVDLFEKYGNDILEALFVVSSVELITLNTKIRRPDESLQWQYQMSFETPHGKGTAIVLPPEDPKCPRCWRYVAPQVEDLCLRCEGVVKSQTQTETETEIN